MRPRTRIAFVLTAMGAAWVTPVAQAQTPAEMAQTAAYAAAHQHQDGGFAANPVGQPSSLGSTNTGLRVLRHVGGSVPHVLECVNYVKSCRVPGGGFSATPGGKPEVVITAIGLMAASELKITDSEMIREAVAYLGKNARSFEEVRMAAAGLEAIGVYSPDSPRWHHQIQAMRNPDGTFGTGASIPFATGGAAAAILRLGLSARAPRRRRQGHQGRPAPRGRLVQGRRAPGPLEQLPDHAGDVHAPRAARSRPPARRSSPAAASPTVATPTRRAARAASAVPTWPPS